MGYGIGIGFALITNTVSSTVNMVSNLKHLGNLDVKARTDADIISISGSLGVVTGSGGTDGGKAVAGTLSISLITNEVFADIAFLTTTADSTGNVSVLADDNSSVIGFAGALPSTPRAAPRPVPSVWRSPSTS